MLLGDLVDQEIETINVVNASRVAVMPQLLHSTALCDDALAATNSCVSDGDGIEKVRVEVLLLLLRCCLT